MYTYSIVICTKDRPERLSSLLASLRGQHTSPILRKKTEILVVDSSRNTQSKTLIELLRQDIGFPIRRFVSPKKGISFARNIGTRKARGTHICFIDDDIVLPPHWLRTLNHTVAKYHSGKCIYYGPIQARFPLSISSSRFVQDALRATPWVFTSLTHKSRPFTANVCIHRSVFQKIGLFREVFGNCEGEVRLPYGEDPDFFVRATHYRIRFHYIPSLTVSHMIDPDRAKLSACLSRYTDDGMNMLLLSYYHNLSSPPARNELIIFFLHELFTIELLDNHPRHIAILYYMFHKVGMFKGCLSIYTHQAYFERYRKILTQLKKSPTIQTS